MMGSCAGEPTESPERYESEGTVVVRMTRSPILSRAALVAIVVVATSLGALRSERPTVAGDSTAAAADPGSVATTASVSRCGRSIQAAILANGFLSHGVTEISPLPAELIAALTDRGFPTDSFEERIISPERIKLISRDAIPGYAIMGAPGKTVLSAEVVVALAGTPSVGARWVMLSERVEYEGPC